ncbi:hypothetical protein [Euzebya pacifica]|uniref:hypothetical protein n=1 Tax=Euzebya pacifica TaxID=1608957 RepID=UPI000DF7954C|nr:hypothetical protein [Euzebya pacifica]
MLFVVIAVLLGGCGTNEPAVPSAAGELADVQSCSGLVTRVGELSASGSIDVDMLTVDLDTRIRELGCDAALVTGALDDHRGTGENLPDEALLSLLRNGAVTLEAMAAANGGAYPTKAEVLAGELPGVMHGAAWDYVTTGPGFACLSVDGLDTVYVSSDGLRSGGCPAID